MSVCRAFNEFLMCIKAFLSGPNVVLARTFGKNENLPLWKRAIWGFLGWTRREAL